jgi:hypothetical protein
MINRTETKKKLEIALQLNKELKEIGVVKSSVGTGPAEKCDSSKKAKKRQITPLRREKNLIYDLFGEAVSDQ